MRLASTILLAALAASSTPASAQSAPADLYRGMIEAERQAAAAFREEVGKPEDYAARVKEGRIRTRKLDQARTTLAAAKDAAGLNGGAECSASATHLSGLLDWLRTGYFSAAVEQYRDYTFHLDYCEEELGVAKSDRSLALVLDTVIRALATP